MTDYSDPFMTALPLDLNSIGETLASMSGGEPKSPGFYKTQLVSFSIRNIQI